MANESQQALVRRFFEEGWNSGNPASILDLVHEDYDANDGGFFVSGSDVPGGLRRLSGGEAFADHIRQYRERYAELRFELERIIDADDVVIVLWRATGTSTEDTFINRGGQEVPRELDSRGVSLITVTDGKVSRHDLFWPGGLH